MRVLIVEDNAEMRRLLRSVLRGVAEATFECADGAEALAAYDRHQPDWVLMDVEMGEVDGITATERITAAHPEARVLMVTNHDSTGLREAAGKAGACGYVLKENLLELRGLLQSAAAEESGNQSTMNEE